MPYANPEKAKASWAARYLANREARLAEMKVYHSNNRERARSNNKRWSKAHPEKVCAASMRWRAKNHDRFREYQNTYRRNRCASDPAYKLRMMLASRLSCAVKRCATNKTASTMKLTGCDIPFLMGYLEAQFRDGMNWLNYGRVWEVDHIRPCATFDFTDAAQQHVCFHYSNLQPLFTKENRVKGARFTKQHQPQLV